MEHRLSKLRYVDLSHNNISFVSSLQTLPNLETLYLNHNHLVSISHAAFLNNSKLVDLDLSHNLISAIEPTALTHLVHMARLDLFSNRLQHVVWEELPWTGPVTGGNLSAITLYENPWNCSCLNSYLIERHNAVQLHNTITGGSTQSPVDHQLR